MSEVELTSEDVRNGWTLEALRAYHQERDKAAVIGSAPIVGGLAVTEFTRSHRAPIRHESARDFNPHNWGKRHV